MTDETRISTAFVWALGISAILALLFPALTAFGAVTLRRGRGDDYRFIGGLWLAVGVAGLAVTGGGFALGLYPYDMRYHEYRKVSGVVDVIDSRLIAGGDGSTANYPLRLVGDPATTWRCDDSRCALIKPGDAVSLWCIREWQANAAPGWACNVESVTPRAGSASKGQR